MTKNIHFDSKINIFIFLKLMLLDHVEKLHFSKSTLFGGSVDRL